MKKWLLFIFIPIITLAQKPKFKNGDLLFINLQCGGMCDAINAVTSGYKKNDFNHMGLVVTENNKDFFVYEAIGKAVVKTPLHQFISYTKKPIYRGELKRKYRNLIPKVIAFCENQLGIPYDNEFIYGNGKYYCSELIYDAFKNANNKQPFFKLFPMTFKEPQSNNYFPIWIEHFTLLGIEIPEGKPGCNPGGMSLDKKITLKKVIYTFP